MSKAEATWIYADENARSLLGADPSVLFSQAGCVKSNSVREVLHVPGFYLKLDKRPHHSFAGEFRSAQLVSVCGIPSVRHLAFGTCDGCSALITGEAEDSTDLNILADVPAEPQFLEHLARFAGTILQSPLFHPDFHAGNILYQKKNDSFLLIDLHGIRVRTVFDRLFSMHRMYRIMLEWREGVSDERLIELSELAGVPDAAHFLPRQLKREAAHLKHEFPRRVRQILSGYAKFTAIDERGILDTALPRTETMQKDENSRELFLLHFFLKLARIPHTGIAGITPDGKAFYPGPETPFRLPPEDLRNRLRCYGFDVHGKQLERGFLADLRPVLEYNRKVFLPYAR